MYEGGKGEQEHGGLVLGVCDSIDSYLDQPQPTKRARF